MIMPIFQAIRDLFAHLLPKKVAHFILPKADYAFLIHPLTFKDAEVKYGFAKYLPAKLINFWYAHYWPIIAAPILGLRSEKNKSLKGYVIAVPLTPNQMFQNIDLAKHRILAGIKLAEKMGASLIGLGGFTSILTHDGKDLLGKANIGITTGNSLSSLIAIKNLRQACKKTGLNLKTSNLVIVGAAGSVASACAKILVKQVKKLLIVDINKAENKKLYNELIKIQSNAEVELANTLDNLNQYDCIITATSSFVPIVKSQHLKPGAIVVDACQPKNIDLDVVHNREDVLVIDSGVAEAEEVICNLQMGLFKNEAYSCLGEVLLLAYRNYRDNFSIGKVNPDQVEELSKYMDNSKIKLAKFRNTNGYISDEKIKLITKIITKQNDNSKVL